MEEKNPMNCTGALDSKVNVGTFMDKKTSLRYVNTVFSHVEWRAFGEFLEE